MIFQGYGGYREIHNSHNSGAIRIYATDALTTSPTGAAIQFFGNNDGLFPGQAHIDSGANDNAAVIFRTAPAAGTITERMRITSGGLVGLGTTSPQGTLHIRSNDPSISNPLQLETPFPGLVLCMKDSWTTATYGNALARIGDNLELRTLDAPRVVVAPDGKVGVGTTAPTQKLDVNGNIYCSGTYEGSDGNLKTDIQPLSGVLDKLSGVRAVSFRWNEKAKVLGAVADGRRIGVLAQELEQVFPELVSTPTPIAADELLRGYPQESLTPEVRERLQRDAERTQYKAVSYSQLTVVLLEAVKELQAQNRSLEERIQVMENGGQ